MNRQRKWSLVCKWLPKHHLIRSRNTLNESMRHPKSTLQTAARSKNNFRSKTFHGADVMSWPGKAVRQDDGKIPPGKSAFSLYVAVTNNFTINKNYRLHTSLKYLSLLVMAAHKTKAVKKMTSCHVKYMQKKIILEKTTNNPLRCLNVQRYDV